MELPHRPGWLERRKVVPGCSVQTPRVCQGPQMATVMASAGLEVGVEGATVGAERRAGELDAGPLKVIGDRDQLAPASERLERVGLTGGGVLSSQRINVPRGLAVTLSGRCRSSGFADW